jgi:hypothetical protein
MCRVKIEEQGIREENESAGIERVGNESTGSKRI